MEQNQCMMNIINKLLINYFYILKRFLLQKNVKIKIFKSKIIFTNSSFFKILTVKCLIKIFQ